jgi:hypothetical protein
MADFRTIQGSPCNSLIAPYIAIVVNDARATVNSIYRGDDAAAILHRHGKHTQRELYAMFLNGQGNPANPPGFSTHELRSDGSAYPVPRGRALERWQQGFEVNDSDVREVIRQAARHGWQLWQPYPGSSEFHHLNFRVRPRPTVHTVARIVRLRATLPRS